MSRPKITNDFYIRMCILFFLSIHKLVDGINVILFGTLIAFFHYTMHGIPMDDWEKNGLGHHLKLNMESVKRNFKIQLKRSIVYILAMIVCIKWKISLFTQSHVLTKESLRLHDNQLA